METLIQLLENAVAASLADIRKKTESRDFREGLKYYFSILKPSIARYVHHQGNDVNDEELQTRYEYETALLHVLTSIFAHNVKQEIVTWPVNELDSPYRWYQISPNLSGVIENVVTELSRLDSPALIISQISGQILDKTSKRYLGEFYTPPSIAEHLIDLSGLHLNELFNGNRVIDPACGGGIILTAIVNKVLLYAQKQNYPSQHVLQSLSENLFGFDIQPFAISITRSLLIYSCLPLLTRYNNTTSASLFPNIKLQDALTTYNQYWSEEGLFQFLSKEKGFHYIIGNPPFMQAKGKLLDYIEHYADVLSGHPNLYQLFLWWAIRAAIQDGIVSFLLPQSMLAGHYFRKLREQIDNETNIISLTRMIDRKGIVDNADLQMMAVCLKVSRDKSVREKGINIRVTRNGANISYSKVYKANYSQIVQQVKETPVFWVVSDHAFDYEICERLESKCGILNELSKIFICGNGSYVWNQHKELLREKEEESTLPLISAASIDLYGFTFPYLGRHPSRYRLFSLVNDRIRPKIYSQPAVLIQRTTPRKVGRRLIAGIPSENFYTRYPEYFLENHVNYVKVADRSNSEILYGLLGWLNSDLINFVFQLRNGTTLVSLYELGLLPVNLKMVKQLVKATKIIMGSTGEERAKHIRALNEKIFDWLELRPKHRNRIKRVLSRKEKEVTYSDK